MIQVKVFVVLTPYQESQPEGVFSSLDKAVAYAESLDEGFVTEWILDEFSVENPFDFRRDWKVAGDRA